VPESGRRDGPGTHWGSSPCESEPRRPHLDLTPSIPKAQEAEQSGSAQVVDRLPAPRIYVDESGTHADSPWLIIGILFVPDHGPLHSDLCGVKEKHKYLNVSLRYNARYKETHLAKFKSHHDRNVALDWIEIFFRHNCYFRSIVVGSSGWDARFFGDPFEPPALKKRRAYKKWTEMLLHPEMRDVRGATLYLDALHVLHGYDLLDHLKDRFTRNYQGSEPWIKEFQITESWKDAHQCLQLADLLTGCVYRTLVSSGPQTERSRLKDHTADHLYNGLRAFGVRDRAPSFWKGFHKKTLTRFCPKFSEWFWKPDKER